MLTSCQTQAQTYTLDFITTPLGSDNNTVTYSYNVSLSASDFESPPSQFSPTLAKTALVMSSTAYSYTYALDNLETLGFEHKAKFNYGDSYSQNGVGTIIASKQIGDTTLVFIILRGTLGKEWYSNFDISKDSMQTGVHQGFNNASKFTLSKLEMYMVNYGIDRDHCKFLVTGHSRGGAAANLVSKSLIDTYGPNNVYAYTFATPNTTTDKNSTDSHYAGIFNFVNPEDFIAYIPLESWGFTKYGTTITFPPAQRSDYSEKIEKVEQYYEQLEGKPFKSFNGTEQKEAFISKALELAPTVEDYYDTKYEIAGLELSLYEYMTVLANVINDENAISNGLILLCSNDTEFEQIKDFIMSGMDIDTSNPTLDYEDSLIAYAHTAQTYLAWLEAYTENM